MKAKKKFLLGMGLVVTPISLAIVATACSSEGVDTSAEKTAADAEVAKVTIDFGAKATTLASTITSTSTFTSAGFDAAKYDFKVTSVQQGSDQRSVSVTFHLELKDSKATPKTKSVDRTLTITGFREVTMVTPTPMPMPEPTPPAPAPEPPAPMPPMPPEEMPMPPAETDPMITAVTNQLQGFLKESLKNLKVTDILESTTDISSFGTALLAEISKEMPNIKIDVQKRKITAGEKSIVLTNKIFDHVKVGLTHLFNTHGGNIQKLVNVFQSKPNSAEELFKDKAVMNFVEFIKPLATVETDWKETLTKTLNRSKGFELKLDFDKFEVFAKTSDTEYKKVVTFKKDFIEEFKKAISSTINTIFSSDTTNKTLVDSVLSIVTTTVLKGVWFVKHSTSSGVEISRMTTTMMM